MKTAGLFFIIFSFSATGFYLSSRCLSILEDIKRAEIFIKNIILFLKNENMTVDEIFKNCIEFGDSKTKNFLNEVKKNNFKNIAYLSEKNNFSKNRTVNLILEEIFLILGKYPAEEQIKEFEFSRLKLQDLLKKEEPDLVSKSKLCKNSGILLGFLISILFI